MKLKSVAELLDAPGLEALEMYRTRLFDYVSDEGYKADCGLVEVQLPGLSQSLSKSAVANSVRLHVRCYRAPEWERSHFFGGENLSAAVASAGAALTLWEAGIDERF